MRLSDGYHDIPDGKLAAVVTFLEMREPAVSRAERDAVPWTLRRVERPGLEWYRALYRRVGAEWLWSSRLVMDDEALAAIVHAPAVEVHALAVEGRDEGLLELDFRVPGECELGFFGLSSAVLGRGAGRWLMNRAVAGAWTRPIKRFWLHTCTLDSPDALAFYVRSGFTPYARQVEVLDDPRLVGILPRSAAPQVPLIERG